MKMLQTAPAGEAHNGKTGGRAVVVGMKLDSPSRELLTWALVKVAQPGDVVVALHVLGNNGKWGILVFHYGLLLIGVEIDWFW